MKYLRCVPYLAIFLANLLIGYLGGLRVLPASQMEAVSMAISDSVIANAPIPSLANGQRSLLLITVDRLEAPQPHLTGIWLVLYIPSDPRLTFLPIYPTPPMKDGGKELTDAFRLNNNGSFTSPDALFLDLIRKHVPWWSGYILLDESAMVEVVDIMTKGEMASKNSDSNQYSQGMSELSIDRDPYSALFGQASLYQDICWGVAWMESGTELAELRNHFALEEGHFSTDLLPDQILADLQNLRGQGGSIVCEFPTLSVQARIVK
jgi:hypothetical protein